MEQRWKLVTVAGVASGLLAFLLVFLQGGSSKAAYLAAVIASITCMALVGLALVGPRK